MTPSPSQSRFHRHESAPARHSGCKSRSSWPGAGSSPADSEPETRRRGAAPGPADGRTAAAGGPPLVLSPARVTSPARVCHLRPAAALSLPGRLTRRLMITTRSRPRARIGPGPGHRDRDPYYVMLTSAHGAKAAATGRRIRTPAEPPHCDDPAPRPGPAGPPGPL